MLLRRSEDSHYDGQSLANGQFRHTVDIGLGSNFQRGGPKRSSLQDLSTRVSIFAIEQQDSCPRLCGTQLLSVQRFVAILGK